MKFIDRIQEMQRLEKLTNSSEASLAVIWGRRRIGKTRLLLEWAHKHEGVYYTADESAPSVQRRYFAIAMDKVLPDFSAVDYPDWATLFTRLAKDAKYKKWRGPLIIDELPYLISMSPELPSVMQRFIDHEAKQAGLIIALCGSSQRMMQGAILEASAPLYGRAQEIIKLNPISIGYMGEALDLTNAREIFENYSIWGGIPRYWELVKNNKGALLDIINELVLDPMGPLNDEPQRLLLEESPSAISLRPILDAIGLGANRLSEIAARIGQPVTSFSRQIHRLIEMDIIKRETPYGALEHNSKKVLYKIKDPFMRFWFEVVAPQRSFFAQALPKIRYKKIQESILKIFQIAWEELCQQAVPYCSNKFGNIFFGQASRYWDKQGYEWDILAESIEDNYLLIGEAKWISKIPTSFWIHKNIEELKKKGIPPVLHKQNVKIVYVLFIPEKPKQLDLPKDVLVLSAEEVIKSLK
jgi:uncharacterized protein